VERRLIYDLIDPQACGKETEVRVRRHGIRETGYSSPETEEEINHLPS
jgi:hypothetical protein